MNTLECIKWLRDAEKAAELKKHRIDDIVKKLEEGEKFEKMWEELSMYRVYKEPNSIEYPYNKYLDDTAKAIERKHFPKEAKDNENNPDR